jgi:hypothetical protein
MAKPGDVSQQRICDEENQLHRRQTIRVIPTLFGHTLNSELATEVEVPNLRRLRLRERRPAGHHQMNVPTEDAGDERFSWDASDPAQITEAKRFFNQMLAKGMFAYRVDPKGRRSGEHIKIFDPSAEEMIFAPMAVPKALAGG